MELLFKNYSLRFRRLNSDYHVHANAKVANHVQGKKTITGQIA